VTSMDLTIVKVVFHGPSKFGRPGGVPYAILRCSGGLTAKGQMRSPVPGETYRFFGDMKPQKGWPDAFEFHSYEHLANRTTDGIAAYLAKAKIEGIGPVKAKALVNAFGIDTLDILRTAPQRAAEVDGISEATVEAIKVHFADGRMLDPAAMAKLTEMFADYRIPRKVIEKCVKAWGSDAPQVIADNPYLFLQFPRVGWKTADAFAIGRCSYPEDGLERHQAALCEALERLGQDGHTAATRAELLTAAERLLGGKLHDEALATSIDDGRIEVATDGLGTVYQLADLAHAEATVAERLKILQELGPRPIAHLASPEWADECGLGEDQYAAAVAVEHDPITIITGAPGTGKSYLIARLIMRLRELGHRSIRCMAPTGKAARRTLELLYHIGIEDIPSTTVHKALEVGPPALEEEGVPKDEAKFGRGSEGWVFKRHIANPLDERIIIVDETSMLDAKLAASLLLAVAPGTRVIFVGDSNQLPSVGPGSVLRDMIAAGIPTAVLSEIRRSDQAGTVVHACHAIINDRVPCHADKVDLPTDNWIHIELDDPAEIAAKIVEINLSLKTFDRVWGAQVISPQKAKLLFGCENLNTLLSKALNPSAYADTLLTDAETGETITVLERDPRVGDKVVRTRNEVVDELVELAPESVARPDLIWDGRRWAAKPCPVVNGDMGTVVDILPDAVLVRFRDPERLCRLPGGEPEIILAYAMTVHKMQGSGAPCVIAPVHPSFYFDEKTGRGLWCRENFYTLISRTEQLLITVGPWEAVPMACRRKTVNRRRTTLAARLKGLAAPEDDIGNVEPQPESELETEWVF